MPKSLQKNDGDVPEVGKLNKIRHKYAESGLGKSVGKSRDDRKKNR